MAHDGARPADDFEWFREYPHFLARTQVHRRLEGKLDLCGVVQQTLFEAQREAVTLVLSRMVARRDQSTSRPHNGRRLGAIETRIASVARTDGD